MFWANRVDKVTGVALAGIVGLSVVGFVAGAPLGEVDPFARGDVEELLRTIHDRFWLWLATLVAFVAQDLLLAALGALLYLAFRDRSPTLALAGAFSLIAGSVAATMHEVGAMTLGFLSFDFLESGGPGIVAVGDSAILAAARAVSVSQGLAALVSQTLTGLGLAAFAALILWAPEGERNPPRWIGVAGLAGAFGLMGTWVFLVNHLAGGGVTLVSEVAALVMLGALARWMLHRPDHSEAAAAHNAEFAMGGHHRAR